MTPEIHPPTRLSRKDAATYLQSRHGLPATAASLAKLASTGGGPHYHRPTPRRTLYAIDELDRWAAARLGPPLASARDQGGAA